mmetsp:Transcript_14617/g.30284  ORF Transcript_14617/g.30284 Transcript_14617/m.30284 type:complete len:215 (+) Transcript_14617:1611-2255(+)
MVHRVVDLQIPAEPRQQQFAGLCEPARNQHHQEQVVRDDPHRVPADRSLRPVLAVEHARFFHQRVGLDQTPGVRLSEYANDMRVFVVVQQELSHFLEHRFSVFGAATRLVGGFFDLFHEVAIDRGRRGIVGVGNLFPRFGVVVVVEVPLVVAGFSPFLHGMTRMRTVVLVTRMRAAAVVVFIGRCWRSRSLRQLPSDTIEIPMLLLLLLLLLLR